MSIDIGWDPLEAADQTDQEVLSAAKKRAIKNILKSYVSNYDPLSEIIQNSLDAIERRREIDKDFIPKLRIKIDLQENSVEVVDNGCGFEEREFKTFLAPSISFKSGGKTRGNKGVGVTYIAYGFNNLTIRTKNKYYTYEGAILRGREWVEDVAGTVPRPNVNPTSKRSDLFEMVDQGTSFKIVFSGSHIRPSNLSWYQATNPEQWLYLLLIKTPLGQIPLRDSDFEAQFDLTVTDKNGNTRFLENQKAIYKFPHVEISASQNLSEIKNLQMSAIESGRSPDAAIRSKKNSNGIYNFYKCEDLDKLMNRISDYEREILKKYNVNAYGYFVYSTEVWDQLNDQRAKLRKGLRILRGGLQIAINGMPQGEMITIPLQKSIGHQNQSHIIVHFEGADPDLGRKGVQPELKELAEKISVAVVRQLSERRDILKSDSGAQADIDAETRVYDWIKDQEKHELENPLDFLNDNFFLPTRKVSVTSTPRSEQDAIVLFNQLVAGGVIRGIKLLGTSQVAQYDGIFRFYADDPFENFEFNCDTNPLGVERERLQRPYLTPPKVLEYKFNLDGLIREFESEEKNESDIHLAVFWDMGGEYKRHYNVTSYLDFDNVHQRPHHGVTHQLRSANSGFLVICLSELIQLLNDPEAAQEYQKAEYGIVI